MCGICGIVGFSDGYRVREKTLTAMRDSLEHRGPDDEGNHIDGQVGLGFRRLSIIDLVTGAQPMHNEDKTVWIVFNGEIYNYPDLRKELKEKGHTFVTQSDTETLIHLYEEEKEGMLERLNGMFSFCIWDKQKQEIFLARDRMGQKPLYYSLSREVDLLSLSKYLTYEYVPAPHSIIKNVNKLKPGHFLKLKIPKKDLAVTKYWEIPLSDDAIGHK